MAIHKNIKRLGWLMFILFSGINILAFIHSYKFTHFADSQAEKTKSPDKLSIVQKIKALFIGAQLPKPLNAVFPKSKFQTIYLQSNEKIECWDIPCSNTSTKDSSKGTILVFHGYGSQKSSMLDRVPIFDSLRYNCFYVDFMGSGGSSGKITTIGFQEAEQVKTAFEYIQKKGEKNIYLYGTSMGAVAIMKAMQDYNLKPNGLILECPFGTMHKTVEARFRNMKVPPFPLSYLLVFWGGIQNGFWAFDHNPVEYAKSIKTPTLLMFGNEDKNVSRKETDDIFRNLLGTKKLKIFEKSGHENYLIKYRKEWINTVTDFLD
ncbi:MAG: alpha/beta hydrolase [Leadbetterella sp.]